jgi:hypothetical protein
MFPEAEAGRWDIVVTGRMKDFGPVPIMLRALQQSIAPDGRDD